MKPYPSIPGVPFFGLPIIAFDKLDGSNVRAEWTRKRGFWKFGRRRGLLDHTNPILLRAEGLILNKYGDDLGRIFREQRWTKATAFFEFHGPQSFAGLHEEGERQTVTLLDVFISLKGMLTPRQFLKLFDGVETPSVLYEGNLTRPFYDSVRRSELEGMTLEGVVCKAPTRIKGHHNAACKIKSWEWLCRVLERYGDDEVTFRRLADGPVALFPDEQKSIQGLIRS